MKFIYEFRTSDNVKHTGIVDAQNRDAAYVILKKSGVRPGRLVEAPGFFNKLFGKGKRWIAICALSVLALVAAYAALRASLLVKTTTSLFEDAERRQLIGDAGKIEKGQKTGWCDVFELAGDRFLASFAIPGVPVAIRNVEERDLRLALDNHVQLTDSDSIEARQIKSIVEGMKTEIQGLLSDGWTLKEVGAALVKRQEREIAYYNQAKREIEEASKALDAQDLLERWENWNAKLRQMGIRLVALPE